MNTKAQKKPAAKREKSKRRAGRDDPEQSRQFIEKAKEIEADQESDDAADSIMERLGSKPPQQHKKEKPDR